MTTITGLALVGTIFLFAIMGTIMLGGLAVMAWIIIDLITDKADSFTSSKPEVILPPGWTVKKEKGKYCFYTEKGKLFDTNAYDDDEYRIFIWKVLGNMSKEERERM